LCDVEAIVGVAVFLARLGTTTEGVLRLVGKTLASRKA